MDKKLILVFTLLFAFIGGIIPIGMGWDRAGLDGPSILGGFVGGLIGVWVGVYVSKQLQ